MELSTKKTHETNKKRKNASLHFNSHRLSVSICILKQRLIKQQAESHDTWRHTSFEFAANYLKSARMRLKNAQKCTSYVSMRIKSATRSNILQPFTVRCMLQLNSVCRSVVCRCSLCQSDIMECFLHFIKEKSHRNRMTPNRFLTNMFKVHFNL